MTISVDNTTIYAVFPVYELPESLIKEYWQRIKDADLLRHRLCDVFEPSVQDAMNLVDLMGSSMYFLVNNNCELVAEFSLTNFTGKAAMVHFSMNPENKPQQSLFYGRTATDQVLNQWGEQDNPAAPYLYSLYGLTPVSNRAACAFVQRVGFKKIGTLPGGQRVNGGDCVDAMITIKERTNGR